MRKAIIILLSILFIFSLIAPASAILNVKEYNAETKEITIKDWLGFSDYLKATLVENTDYCLIDCTAKITFTSAQDLTPKAVLSNIKFYDTINRDKTNVVTYKIELEQEREVIQNLDVWGVCSEQTADSKTLANGTIANLYNFPCVKDTTTITNTETYFVNFQDITTYEAGKTYNIIISASKPRTSSIDWTFELGGLDIGEYWAWWNSTWSYKRQIDNSYPIINSITNNTPLLINLSTSTYIAASHLDTNCNGITFTNKSEDTELRSAWNNKTHTSAGCNTANSLLWVKYEGYDKGENNTIYNYYDASASYALPETDVFLNNANQNFTAVWLDSFVDRTGGGHTLSEASTAAITTNGYHGYGFDGAGGGAFTSATSVLAGMRSVSVAFWVYPRAVNEAKGLIFEGDDGDTGFNINLLAESVGKIGFNVQGGSCNVKGEFSTANVWQHVVAVVNTGVCYLYLNGTLISSGGAATALDATPTTNFQIVASGGYNPSANAIIDSVMVWGRPISSNEVALLYNNQKYNVSQYTGAEETNVLPISTILITPEDMTMTTLDSRTFSCNSTATTGETMRNVTTYVWLANGTTQTNLTNVNSLNLLNYTQNYTIPSLPNGNHTWNCLGADTGNNVAWANTNRTISVDNINPTIQILTPLNNSVTYTQFVTTNITLNATISDTNLNMCWVGNSTTNITYMCNTAFSNNLTSGYHNITFYANDSLGNTHENLTRFLINRITYTPTYNTTINEGETGYFNLSILSSDVDFSNVAVNLTYNTTLHISNMAYASKSSSAYNTINTPAIAITGDIPFYWSVNVNGLLLFNTSTYSQMINPLSLNLTAGNCGLLTTAQFYDFKDEQNLTSITGNTLDYNLRYGSTNATFKEVYGRLTNINNLSICINTTIYSSYKVGYGELSYTNPLYEARRFYIFENATLSNDTQTNRTLYHLAQNIATPFTLVFKTNQLAYYINNYVALLHWYPDLNSYNVVDMGKTDSFGQTIVKVIQEDVDYRIALYERNGTLIYMTNPARLVCTETPCTFNIQVDTSVINDFPNAYGVDSSLTYNTTTHTFTYVWSDASGTTSQMRLFVYQFKGNDTRTICDTFTSGTTGAMACDASSVNGTLIANVYRLASPQFPIASLSVNTTSSIFRGSAISLFISFIFLVFAALAGSYSPFIAILLSVVALLPAVVMGSISLSIIVGLAAIAIIIFHVIGRVNR